MSHVLLWVLAAFCMLLVLKNDQNHQSGTRNRPEPKPKPQRPKQSWREEARMHWRDFRGLWR